MSQTIFSAYNNLKHNLEKIDESDYVFEAKQIIKYVTGYTNREILEKYTENLTQVQENKLIAILEQRKMRYPLQYILGRWDFYGLPFMVGPGVLIPRADTETLVEKALDLIKDIKEPKVLDLCTGSGCIAVAIAKNRPDAEVTAVDKYDVPLSYAKKNIELNKTENITLVTGDIFEGAESNKKYDIIVSNPPYLNKAEMENLQPEVSYEPDSALIGGDDGMDFYRVIIKTYKHALKSGGIMAFEIGATENQNKLPDMLKEAGFSDVQIALDIEDRQRVVFGTYNNL